MLLFQQTEPQYTGHTYVAKPKNKNSLEIWVKNKTTSLKNSQNFASVATEAKMIIIF